MANTTNRKNVKSVNKRKRAINQESNKNQNKINSKKQIGSIIMFIIGLLFFALSIIKGANYWELSHKILLGLFGISSYFIGPLIMGAGIFFASTDRVGKFSNKVWQLIVLFILLCTFITLISNDSYIGVGFFNNLSILYEKGKHLEGGGLIGGILGITLHMAFGKTAASVVVFVIMFGLLLIITGSTLIGFFKGMAKPIKTAKNKIEKLKEEDIEKNIDIPIDDMPCHPVSSKRFCVPNIDEPKTKKKIAQDEVNSKKNIGGVKIDELVKKASDNQDYKEKEIGLMMGDSVNENGYVFPPLSILKDKTLTKNIDISSELRSNADRLVNTLKSFGVETRIINISRGPSVTRYELQPSAGVKISKITNLSDDIALNLAAEGVRIEAPIPNKAAVGIEVPNKKKDIVSLKEIIKSEEFVEAKSALSFALGKDIAGNVRVADIAKMPHLLIAGATGSGKSVCINSMIVSMLYKSSPKDLRMLMIDPKVVELGVYNGIPHLLVPVVTNPQKAAGALGWAVTEMLNRYKLFAEAGVRDLVGFNEIVKKGRLNPQGEAYIHMPQIVIVIDELADLMMAASRDVEDSICRLAQMARAAGMHLVIATQRPSVDVITGVIKANIPSRIAFTVSSSIDSRTILDTGGAEKLLGKGDMLFNPVGSQKSVRVQGCFISDNEVEKVVEFIKSHENAEYSDDVIEEIEKQSVAKESSNNGGGFEDTDPVFSQAVEVILDASQASTSFLQRRLKLGYARAARIMDEMETKGIVGPQEGSKPREILMTRQQWLEMNLNSKNNEEQ